MASVKSFEEFESLREARELVREIYRVAKYKEFSSDRSLTDQIRRAAVSVLSNIAEGFERGTKDEFIYFLYVAKGSAGEVRAQLYAALDQKYISIQEFNNLKSLSRRVSAKIYYLIQSLKGSEFRGLKFKPIQKTDKGEEWLKAEKERLGIVFPWEKKD